MQSEQICPLLLTSLSKTLHAFWTLDTVWRDSRASLLVWLTVRDLVRNILQTGLSIPQGGILNTGVAIPLWSLSGCAMHTRSPATNSCQPSIHSLKTAQVSIDLAHRTAASACFQIQPSEKILSLCFKVTYASFSAQYAPWESRALVLRWS